MGSLKVVPGSHLNFAEGIGHGNVRKQPHVATYLHSFLPSLPLNFLPSFFSSYFPFLLSSFLPSFLPFFFSSFPLFFLFLPFLFSSLLPSLLPFSFLRQLVQWLQYNIIMYLWTALLLHQHSWKLYDSSYTTHLLHLMPCYVIISYYLLWHIDYEDWMQRFQQRRGRLRVPSRRAHVDWCENAACSVKESNWLLEGCDVVYLRLLLKLHIGPLEELRKMRPRRRTQRCEMGRYPSTQNIGCILAWDVLQLLCNTVQRSTPVYRL